MTIKIFIADDHLMFRETLRDSLALDDCFLVVGETGDGREAVRHCGKLKPDVAILDIGMPGLNGIDAARKILEASPKTRVIALTMHSSAKFISEMFEAGATGYVIKECAFEELTSAIRTVAEGKTYLSPEVAGTAMSDYVRRIGNGPEAGTAEAALSPREREILQLIAEGKAIKEVAARLGLSRKTVENHRSHIMDKLGINSTAGLTKYAIREGLTSLN